MAKKVRRVRKSRRGSNKSGNATGGGQDTGDKLQQEYAYVIKDLRQVLLLAGIMFVLLIVLNLLLQ